MTAVAPDCHQLILSITDKLTYLVDGITNIIRLGDIPNVESHIPENQLNPLRFRTSNAREHTCRNVSGQYQRQQPQSLPSPTTAQQYVALEIHILQLPNKIHAQASRSVSVRSFTLLSLSFRIVRCGRRGSTSS